MPCILVTGASSGIGAALVSRYLREGWSVIGTVRDPRRALDVSDATSGSFHAEELDLSIAGAPRALAERVLERYGCPDVLVNNAGMLQWGPVELCPAAEVETVFRVNVLAQVELVKAFAPAMRDRGTGTIVNVTSLGGRMVFPFFSVYNASKHALEGFSEGLWHELKPFGIRVKAIEPGFVQTPIWERTLRDEAGAVKEGPAPYTRYMAAMAGFETAISKRTSAEACAEKIFAAIADDSDRLRYPVASYAKPILRARRILGDQFMLRFFHKRWMGTE